jgi:hypothetical protein
VTSPSWVWCRWLRLTLSIAENNLSILKRKPSDLRRYLTWTKEIKAKYGSMSNYILQERLRWQPLESSTAETGPIFAYKNPVPFADPGDYKILPNDWPYGLTPDITHIVVWLKKRIPTNETNGDLIPESRELVERFVREKFEDRLKGLSESEGRVQWFKNWTALQSVRGLEHVHVLVRGVPDDILEEWTGEKVMRN